MCKNTEFLTAESGASTVAVTVFSFRAEFFWRKIFDENADNGIQCCQDNQHHQNVLKNKFCTHYFII